MTTFEQVFVYGTLKKYGINHARYVGLCEAMGQATTEPVFSMFDHFFMPVVVSDGTTSIIGEVYKVDKWMLERLDNLEAVPMLFERKKTNTTKGEAWIYYVAKERYFEKQFWDHGKNRERTQILSGFWNQHLGIGDRGYNNRVDRSSEK